jgi:hypothetical protein
MLSNGNSFGYGGREGNERSILSSRWMFPGATSGIQHLGSPL